MMGKSRKFCAAMAAFACALALPARAMDTLKLMYYPRPPLIFQDKDGALQGDLGARIQRMMTAAAVPYSVSRIPARRQLMEIEVGATATCGIGWYKNQQRGNAGQFSLPVYRDSATVGLTNSTTPLSDGPLAQLLQRDTLTVLLKGGLTYGDETAQQLQKAKAHISNVTGENTDILEMLGHQHGDLMLATRDEAQYLVQTYRQRYPLLKIVTFTDLHDGEERYLYCSKAVDPQTMERINKAIGATP